MSVYHPSLTVYNPQLLEVIEANFQIDIWDDTCTFSEGPVWNPEGFYLFSDIPENTIMSIGADQKKGPYISDSGYDSARGDEGMLSRQIGSNGLAYAADGSLIVCQHGNGAVARWSGATLFPFITSYEGLPFNSPNDLAVHPDGSIFFSDPPYGLKDQQLLHSHRQSFGGIYCYREETVSLVSTAYDYPNGLCFSPDYTILYACSSKEKERFVLRFDALTLAPLGKLCDENGDGIKCDQLGNLWLCTKEGVLIISEKGERLGLIALPSVPANCCWGGANRKDLLITARQNIFHLAMLQK
ncbi:MAG: SMP-30/gluconolactonase/LRE family protein [Chitinophagaceae bacterium]